MRGCDAPPKSAKRSTFSHKWAKNGVFVRGLRGEVQKVHFFWSKRSTSLGSRTLPSTPKKIDPGYGPVPKTYKKKKKQKQKQDTHNLTPWHLTSLTQAISTSATKKKNRTRNNGSDFITTHETCMLGLCRIKPYFFLFELSFLLLYFHTLIFYPLLFYLLNFVIGYFRWVVSFLQSN